MQIFIKRTVLLFILTFKMFGMKIATILNNLIINQKGRFDVLDELLNAASF